MSELKKSRPAVLCILDGWGHRDDPTDNAIAQANTPVWDRLMATCPQAFLQTSGDEVGLPDGQMGNSEVGHMNLGAGRIVMQDLPRIDAQVASGALLTNDVLQEQISTLLETGGTCHILGLLSPGGVHSHQDHMVALAMAVSTAGVPVAIHAFLDGRDTPPKSAAGFVEKFQADIDSLQGVGIATVTGRYFAMDRDKRWDRVAKGYDAMTAARGNFFEDAASAIQAAYEAGQTDEFVEPCVLADYAGMGDGDGLLMANFRADRAREILTALCDPVFDGFARDVLPEFSSVVGLVEYSKALNDFVTSMYPPKTLSNTIGQVVAESGGKQLRIAETEKYAHVTFFFNGGEETVFDGEERILVPSPKVATYDLQPEMSAPEVTDKLVESILSQKFDFILVNFANGDMVGHTGILSAAMKAAETLDACLARLEEAITKADGTMFVTADHGNAECMRNATTGEPHTAHTMDAVPAVLVNAPTGVKGLANGRLADVAPTMLALMGLEVPGAMTGEALIRTEATSSKDVPADERASA
jgi:2,3-bisphosphoglycerate-independent phosphoglycerate mutase